jgi:hypothetical protein
MNRQDYNRVILQLIADKIMMEPDLRFGQILINLKVLKTVNAANIPVVEDPFYEEPKVMLKRMLFND